MFKIRIGSSNIVINGAMIPLIIIFYFSSYLWEYLRLFSYILLHELMHGLVAVMCGRQTGDVHITPGGMTLELEGEEVSRGRTLLILLAGPAMNMVLAGIFHGMNNTIAAQSNLALAVFNLLPVKPLDGHGILCAISDMNKPFILKCINILSKIIAVFFASAIIYGFIRGQGSIISLIACFFLMSQISKSKMEGRVMNVKNLFYRKARFQKKGYYEGRIVTVLASTEVCRVMALMGYDCFHFIYVLDENFTLKGILTEQQIINAVIDNQSNIKFGDLISDKK